MTKEADLMRQIQRYASRYGSRVFRNNTGSFRIPGTDRWFHGGLCVGSSDLVGWTRDGRFLAIEVKTARGRLTAEQAHFLDAVNAAGGVGILARSVNDLTILE